MLTLRITIRVVLHWTNQHSPIWNQEKLVLLVTDMFGSICIVSLQVMLSNLIQPTISQFLLTGTQVLRTAVVRENASVSGQLKVVTVRNRGVGVGTTNITYTKVPILGDGSE